MTKKTFDELFLEALDEALLTLGESARQSIYFHLADKFKIEKNTILSRLESFECGLDKIFGIGARYIEILIMQKLYEKVGQPLEWEEEKELIFVDYVNAAKQTFSRKGKTVGPEKARN